MLTIRKDQYELFRTAAVERFYRSLFAYLIESFPEYNATQAQALFSECLNYAASADITTEYGLTSLTTVSFSVGYCIASDNDYREFHDKCVAETEDSEAAINAIYEGLF